MAKRKLFKYAQLQLFKNVFLPINRLDAGDFYMKGKWHDKYFCNTHPIVVELGCGKGEYTNALAQMHPERNYIGIDFKGDRLYAACKTASDKQMKNVAFIRNQIQFIERFFVKDEVDEIWITFPDPQLQKPKHHKRLTSPDFLKRYSKIAKKGAVVHLKTDNIPFFDYTVNLLNELNQHIEYLSRDIYSDAPDDTVLGIKTYYEQMFLAQGATINYLRFKLNMS